MSASRGGRLFVALQYLLPQHGISALVRALTRVRTPWFKNLLVRAFLRAFKVDLREAALPDPLAYASFNEFFTRALRPGARPIDPDPASIASPVDGTVSECGPIEGDTLVQAKGRPYRLGELLAGQPWAAGFAGGSFLTIYLAPHDYHRIHMPVRGRLEAAVFVPGRLFSVNAATTRQVPRLFARNERILTLFGTDHGRFALVMVGALNVGSMSTVWTGEVAAPAGRAVAPLAAPDLTLEKGAELGRFNMGSTVILLFEAGRARWRPECRSNAPVRVGRAIGGLA